MSGSVVLASDTAALPKYPWSHNGFFSAFDTASIRRGFEVYRQVSLGERNKDGTDAGDGRWSSWEREYIEC